MGDTISQRIKIDPDNLYPVSRYLGQRAGDLDAILTSSGGRNWPDAVAGTVAGADRRTGLTTTLHDFGTCWSRLLDGYGALIASLAERVNTTCDTFVQQDAAQAGSFQAARQALVDSQTRTDDAVTQNSAPHRRKMPGDE